MRSRRGAIGKKGCNLEKNSSSTDYPVPDRTAERARLIDVSPQGKLYGLLFFGASVSPEFGRTERWIIRCFDFPLRLPLLRFHRARPGNARRFQSRQFQPSVMTSMATAAAATANARRSLLFDEDRSLWSVETPETGNGRTDNGGRGSKLSAV